MTPQGLRLQRMRTARNLVSVALSMAATLFGLFWLIWILWTTATKGFAALKWDLIFKMTPPPGADGGLANALFGSLLMSVVAILLGTPSGLRPERTWQNT